MGKRARAARSRHLEGHRRGTTHAPIANCEFGLISNTTASDKTETGCLGLFSAALGFYTIITLQSLLGASHHFGYEKALPGEQHSKAGGISQEL